MLLVEVRVDGSGGIELMKLSLSRFSLRSLLGAIYIHDMGEDPDMNALKKKFPPCFVPKEEYTRRSDN